MTNETYFQLEGEFLGVCALEGYKLKYLQLRTADRDVVVKIPKELRMGLVYRLAIGDRLRCEGIQKDFKLKAHSIEQVVPVRDATPTIEYPEIEPKVKILICQKSHCRNNGGKEIYSALTEQLDSHNLNDSITLKSTGCLKYCKQAPNLVVLPDRSRYHNVRSSQIPAIISTVRDRLSIEQN